jgi:hypothetical protein
MVEAWTTAGDAMITERSFRRLPLRDLMTDAEKRVRDLHEHFNVTWLARIADLRDLSRPIRKRSHFPTLHALQNSLQKAIETNDETRKLIDYLAQELTEILEHARREQLARR